MYVTCAADSEVRSPDGEAGNKWRVADYLLSVGNNKALIVNTSFAEAGFPLTMQGCRTMVRKGNKKAGLQ
ncbi:hypothetical protein ACTHGU_02510 [Chitinophagaceae bacterium MMS25-I14]